MMRDFLVPTRAGQENQQGLQTSMDTDYTMLAMAASNKRMDTGDDFASAQPLETCLMSSSILQVHIDRIVLYLRYPCTEVQLLS